MALNSKYDKEIIMKIFADGADIASMEKVLNKYHVSGFTTNPSLMVKAGVENYLEFAQEAVSKFNVPISFEVFSDDFEEMYNQATKLNSIGKNVYVKIPVSNTKGYCSASLVKSLSDEGVKVNVTAIFTTEQVEKFYNIINHNTPSIMSIFAGRIADTLRDPVYTVKEAVTICKHPNCEVLWASARQVLDVLKAKQSGCDIITLFYNFIEKFDLIDKNLDEFSLDTIKTFYEDARKAGYSL